MKELVNKADSFLGGLFKGAPKMPDSSKESLVKAWPWIAVIFGVLQLMVAKGLWDVVRLFDKVNSVFGAWLGTAYVYGGKDKFFVYLSLITLVVDAVILLMAFPKLQKRAKAGWDLVFLGALLNVLYSVFNFFVYGRGMGDFLSALIGSTIGFYLLYQVKDKYKS